MKPLLQLLDLWYLLDCTSAHAYQHPLAQLMRNHTRISLFQCIKQHQRYIYMLMYEQFYRCIRVISAVVTNLSSALCLYLYTVIYHA